MKIQCQRLTKEKLNFFIKKQKNESSMIRQNRHTQKAHPNLSEVLWKISNSFIIVKNHKQSDAFKNYASFVRVCEKKQKAVYFCNIHICPSL